ncbi:MAG: PLP-dependent aminotransferase family protein, partial [Gemmatimonadota bacterium]
AVPGQAAAAAFIDDGLLAQHTRRMRRVYAERHERIVHLLERDLGEYLAPLPAAGGLHLAAFMRGRDAPDDHAVAERARADGVVIFPLSYHYVDVEPRGGFLFGYGAIASEQIEDGLRRVRRALTRSVGRSD